jgi:putative FmdB family regulatory protein
MPAYLFRCETCALKFERIVKVGVSAHPCPECEAPVQRVLEGQTFGHAFEEPPHPTNSGIYDYDNPSADKAVGRDAFKKWADYEERKKFKENLRKSSGTHALTRTSFTVGNNYAPMTTEAYTKRVKEGKEVVRAIQEHKNEP